MATPFNPEIIKQLHSELLGLRGDIYAFEALMAVELLSIPPEKLNDIQNLIHYMAFKQKDVSEIRQKLRLLGLNSLEQIESDVLGQLNTVICALVQMFPELPLPDIAAPERNWKDFRPEIDWLDLSEVKMRTLPSDAPVNYQIPQNLLKEGMNMARIGTQENDPKKMLRMIHNLHRVADDMKLKCPVMLDLEDTSVRIGEFECYSPAVKVEPERNEKGQVIRKATIFFVLPGYKQGQQLLEIPIECEGYRHLKSNDVVYLRDSAERSRKMIISEVGKGFIKAETDKTIYLDKGLRIMFIRKGEIIDHATIGKIPSREIQVTVQKGDTISILPPGMPGHPTILNSNGELLHPARLSCTTKQIFATVKAGQRIFFGKKQVEGLIKEVSMNTMQVSILRAKHNNYLLRGKRIYFPDCVNCSTNLDEDRLKTIEPVVQKADLVCVSAGANLSMAGQYFTSIPGSKKALVLKIGAVHDLKILPQQLLEGLKIDLSGVWIRQKEISVGQSARQTDQVIGEIIRWCTAARIMIIQN